jgi:hypothetical protein
MSEIASAASTAQLPVIDELSAIAGVARGPWGLLAQLAAAGYLLAAFVFFRWRRYPFHPDVINVRGALVGIALWVILEGLAWAGTGTPLDAVPWLGSLLAVPATGSILGRAHWILIARRAQGPHDPVTKWEYKTRASGAALVAIAVGVGTAVVPLATILATGVIAAGFLIYGGGSRWARPRGVPSQPVAAPASVGPNSVAAVLPGELLIVGDLSSPVRAAAVIGGLLRRPPTPDGGNAPADRIRVCVGVARRAAAQAVSTTAEASIARIRELARVEGISEVGEPVIRALSFDGRVALGAIISVVASRESGTAAFGRAARTVAEGVPELTEVLVCVDV